MGLIRRLWRYVNAISVRVMVVVIVSGCLTAGFAVWFVARAMSSSGEARLVDHALATAERVHGEIAARLDLAETQLGAAARLLDADRGPDVPGLLSPLIVAARLERSGELLDIGDDPAARRWLVDAPRRGRKLVDGALLVGYEVGPVNVVAAIALGDLLSTDATHRTWLTTHTDDPGIGATLTVRRERRADGEWAMATQPLGADLVIHHDASLAPARAEVDAAIRGAIRYAAIVAGLMLVVVAWILARTVTRPVRTLAQAVHDRDRDVRIGMPDNEIGELAQAIASSREALARDAGLLVISARFAQDVVRLKEPDAVLAMLQTVLDETHPAGGWQVLSLDELDGGAAAARGLDGAAGGERVSTREHVHASGEHELVISLADDGSSIGVVVGRTAASEHDRRHIEGLCQIAVTAVRGLGFGELAATNEKLAVIGRLSASIAHEMNNPLHYMLVNLTMLEEDLSGELRALASDARAGTERLVQIVKDMSAMSRGGSESSGRVELVELVADRVKIAAGRARRVAIEVKSPAAVVVDCARGPIGQAILNLLVNAIDAVRGRQDPRVIVSVDAVDGRGTITVHDNGAGISPANQRKLFGAFFTTKAEHGTGLGLYLSRMFVRGASGELELVDTGPHGTTFRLTLPLADGFDARTAVDDLPLPDRPRVLVIDDEPAIVRTLERLIGRTADVVATTDPDQGLRAATSQPFHLVLCDWNMPVMSGAEFLARLRQIHPGNAGRLVIMTGGDPPRLDGVRVVSKPIDRFVMDGLIDPSAETMRDAGRAVG